MNLFDILKAVSYTKKDLSKDPDFEKVYNPFMINRYLSMLPETLIYAEYLDSVRHLPKKQQFMFLLEMLPKANRYFKYIKKSTKPDKLEKIKLLMENFQCREEIAKTYLKILTKKQISEIKKSTGG